MTNRPLPPGLLGGAFLLWGWQSGHWFLALLCLVLYEFSTYFRWHAQVTLTQVYRLVDFSSLIFIAFVVYAAFNYVASEAVFLVTEWLPIIWFPLLALQKYSPFKTLPVTALSLHMRKHSSSKKTLDMSYALFILCIVSASTGNILPALFFSALSLLCGWFFWACRNPRFSALTWALLMPLLLLGSYTTHQQIVALQIYVEDNIPQWYLYFLKGKTDPYHRTTALGFIGNLKLSEKILFRVKTEDGKAPPALLRNASYTRFSGHAWSAKASGFLAITPPNDTLLDTAPERLKILMALDNGAGILPLPMGTQAVFNLPAEFIARNSLGAVKVKQGPDHVFFDVAYDPLSETGYRPDADDLSVPYRYRKTLHAFTQQYHLKGLSHTAQIQALRKIFEQEFVYTLNLANGQEHLPLIDFLARTKRGHCEYFASSTVLILRQLGIPSRYASGYGVHEYSDREDFYVVRQNHAHAWALAYIDGHWIDVDNTPPDWAALEDTGGSLFGLLHDVWSWMWSEIEQWRMQESSETQNLWLLGLLAPLIWLLYRYFHGVTITRRQRAQQNTASQPIDEVLKALTHYHIQQQPGETIRQCVNRAQHIAGVPAKPQLLAVVAAYYQYRFLKTDCAQALNAYRDAVALWLRLTD